MELIYDIVETIATICDGLFMGYFFYRIFPVKKKDIKLYFISFVLMQYIVLEVTSEQYWLQLVGMVIISLSYAVIVHKGSISYKILIIVLYDLISSFVITIAFNVTSLITGQAMEKLIYNETPERVAMLILSKILWFIVLKLVADLISKKAFNPGGSNISILMLVMSAVACGLITEVSQYHEFSVDQKFSFVLIVLIIIVLNVLIACILSRITEDQAIKTELEILDLKIKEETELLKEINKSYENICQLRHDEKHYYSLLKNLLHKKDYDEMRFVLNDILEERFYEADNKYINSNVINLVINNKVSTCNYNEIPVQVNIVDNMDIGTKNELNAAVIISNLLDYAIESVKEAKTGNIQLNISFSGGDYLICVSGIMKGKKPTEDEEISDNFGFYGVCIESVKQILKKLGGTINIINKDENVFFETRFANE